jgi:hypothetical protein
MTLATAPSSDGDARTRRAAGAFVKFPVAEFFFFFFLSLF